MPPCYHCASRHQRSAALARRPTPGWTLPCQRPSHSKGESMTGRVDRVDRVVCCRSPNPLAMTSGTGPSTPPVYPPSKPPAGSKDRNDTLLRHLTRVTILHRRWRLARSPGPPSHHRCGLDMFLAPTGSTCQHSIGHTISPRCKALSAPIWERPAPGPLNLAKQP